MNREYFLTLSYVFLDCIGPLTLWYSSFALLSSSKMSMGRGSGTPLALTASTRSGDSLWAWSASCFTILRDNTIRETEQQAYRAASHFQATLQKAVDTHLTMS